MQSLGTDLRSQLESTVEEAREVAETGARAALNQLGVGDREKPGYLSEEQAELRRRLRARGRQLGDKLKNSGEQETIRLAREIAYEHWHRMLFARFLAENDLLVHPELDVAVTLEDCEDLADEEGARDGFELAAQFATGMLPQIFREDDPVLGLDMAPEHRNKLKRMAEDLPEAVFEADDSLGWVYQFWQSKRKDEVNDSGDKIGADELPAVTQLFTEHYMVQFLLDNTLGAWWTARHPEIDLDLDFEYLRFVEDEDTGEEVPAAGSFDGWPDTAAELTVMDPCMGSGHFLVTALPMLAQMRMHEEALSAEEAVDRVIAENLHGLEIDERCTQIAAFALAMAAWTFNGNSGYRELPEMNLACSGLAPEGDLEDWETLAGDDQRRRNGMRRLYEIFQDAPTLGSLIDPSAPENRLDTATFEELEPLLVEALTNKEEVEETERGVVAFGIARAAELLSTEYHFVTTNVPYLGRGKQSDELMQFCETNYPKAKTDLATVFIDRCRSFLEEEGMFSAVTPQNWLFQGQYQTAREHWLKSESWSFIARLGAGAFNTISGEVVKAMLFNFKHLRPDSHSEFAWLNVSNESGVRQKNQALKEDDFALSNQFEQFDNPDSRVLLTRADLTGPYLSEYAESYQGLVTGDSPRFIRHFWEIDLLNRDWEPYVKPSDYDGGFGGRTDALWWEKGEGRLHEYARETRERLHDMHESGNLSWGRRGAALGRINLHATPYFGSHYDNSVAAITPKKEEDAPAIWEFCSSDEFKENVRVLDQNLSLTNQTLLKVPCDIEYWREVAEEEPASGLPDPHTDDPTQWIFHGHPKPSERPLQVAVARLLGYRWPAERDADMELSDEAHEWIERCNELDHHVDDDGIVCIPPVQGERAAADRLRDLLADAYGDDWGEGVLQDLLDEWGYRSGGLQAWLDGATARQKGKFAQQHNKLFGHRPFIWHVSDEHEDGFSALVNYHQLDRANLERLTYTYLGDWIKQQEAAMERGDEGAEGRLLAAQDLQEELKKIIEGEPPYDIFVRWKEAHEQPIGWEPDLNDGVLLNINPFIEAGILRDEPRARYTKDRGKNPEGATWGRKRYNRYEDVPDEHKLKEEDGEVIEHLTNDVKRRVREEEETE